MNDEKLKLQFSESILLSESTPDALAASLKEKLLQKHHCEMAFLEMRAKQTVAGSPGGLGSKKRFGSAVAVSVSPQSPAALKAAAAIVEMQARHVKELEELENRLAQLSLTAPFIDAGVASFTAAGAGGATSSFSANAGATSSSAAGVASSPVMNRDGDYDNDDLLDNNDNGTVDEDKRDSLTSSALGSSASPSLTRSGSKAQRRREQKAAEFAALRSESSYGNGSSSKLGPSMREVEIEALQKQLKPLGFGIKMVAADGHCMFRSISEQLRLKQLASTSLSSSFLFPDYLTLRTRASEYITVHWSSFAPFLPYDSSDRFPEGGSEEATKEAVKRYCSRIASTNCWGGHPELRALSATIGVPIIVYRANAAPLVFEPDGGEVNLNRGNKDSVSDSALRVTFHAHYLTLGEHYNTVISL